MTPTRANAPEVEGGTSAPQGAERFVAPDWATYPDELACPLCGYNLRGLVDPRCPECGYRFVWPELLDARRREHPYLFEHHPRRPIWSFGKTL